MKVKILGNVKGFSFNGTRYLPGETLEVPTESYVPYLMEVIPESPSPESTVKLAPEILVEKKPRKKATLNAVDSETAN
jgi:hypothetical protein